MWALFAGYLKKKLPSLIIRALCARISNLRNNLLISADLKHKSWNVQSTFKRPFISLIDRGPRAYDMDNDYVGKQPVLVKRTTQKYG